MRRLLIFIAALAISIAANAENKQLVDDRAIIADSTALDTIINLQGAVIKGTLPKTKVKGDAMRTLINGSILEKSGTATDALSRIHSLKAEKDGSVEVLGRGAAEVYINGRKVQDLRELTRLNAEQIQYVDVVQNPGARYSASTKAVVRIQLKKAKGEGFSFQDYLSSYYQYATTVHNNIDVNYRTGGLDVTASFWAGRYNHQKSFQENDLTYYVGQDKYFGHSYQEAENLWKGFSPQLQVNYMLNANHSFGAFYKYDRNPKADYSGFLNTESYKNGEYLEHSENQLWKGGSFHKHIFNAYYNGKIGKLGVDFNLDGFFNTVDDPNHSTETTIAIAPGGESGQSHVENDTKSSNNFIASKLFFTYPILRGSLSAGGEFSHNNRFDSYSFGWENQPMVKSTDTNIKETVACGFLEYGRQFGKLSAQIGVRYEYLGNSYYNFGKKDVEVSRKYGDWFPTAALALPIDKWQLSLSYRRDIERPAYDNLSSSTLYVNKYTRQSGNPYLSPQYTHSLVFNAAWQTLNISINYNRIKDNFTLVTMPDPESSDPLKSLIKPVNGSDGYNQLMINPSYRPAIGIWHPMWSAGLVFQNYKTLCAEGTEITLDHPFGQFVWNNDIELPEGWRLNAMVQFATKGDYTNFRMTRYGWFTKLGVQKDFNLKSLGTLTLDARCYDPFNISKNETVIYGLRELTSYNPARRTFQLDLTWKFNEARSKYRGSGAGEKQKARMK